MGEYHVSKEGQLVFESSFIGLQYYEKQIVFIIPPKVVFKGTEAVKKFTEKEIKRIKLQRQAEEHTRRAKWDAINIPMSVIYAGLELRGRITKARQPRGLYQVWLESPVEFAGSTIVYGSMARAIFGHIVWINIDTGILADWALDEAQGLLIEIYRKGEHTLKYGNIIELSNELNRDM